MDISEITVRFEETGNFLKNLLSWILPPESVENVGIHTFRGYLNTFFVSTSVGCFWVLRKCLATGIVKTFSQSSSQNVFKDQGKKTYFYDKWNKLFFNRNH